MEKKLCLAAIGVLLVFTIIFTAVLQTLTPSKETEIQNSLKETDRNTYYGCLAGNLLASFPKVLIQTEYGEEEVIGYPPEYGGAYIDESNTLHILLTKTANITTKTSYLEIMDNDEEIIFEIVDFPLSFLYEVQRTFDATAMGEFDIAFTGINEVTNRLDIGLLDITKENEVTEFLENKINDFDARCLTFKVSAGFTISAAHTANNDEIIFTDKARASNTLPPIQTHI